jgi:hypothetical protein
VRAASDDRGAVELANDARECGVGLRAQAVALEDERQRVAGKTMAPAERETPAWLGLDHPEAGHRLPDPPVELGSSLHWIAIQHSRKPRATAAPAQNPQQRPPDRVSRCFDRLNVLVDEG